jgi:phage host-nuclease inhibitor protein Gam
MKEEDIQSINDKLYELKREYEALETIHNDDSFSASEEESIANKMENKVDEIIAEIDKINESDYVELSDGSRISKNWK